MGWGAPPRPLLLRKMTKNQISLFIFIGAQRTRLFSARHSILLTEEIVFDYSIDSLVQKLVKLEYVGNNGKMKKFEKFQIFDIFQFFFDFQQTLFFSYLLSYNINQVVRKYLLDQENRLVHTKWARGRLRAR